MFNLFKKKPKIDIVMTDKPDISVNEVITSLKDDEHVEPYNFLCTTVQQKLDFIINNGPSTVKETQLSIKQKVLEDKHAFDMLYEILYYLKYNKNRSTSIFNQLINTFLTNDGKEEILKKLENE